MVWFLLSTTGKYGTHEFQPWLASAVTGSTVAYGILMLWLWPNDEASSLCGTYDLRITEKETANLARIGLAPYILSAALVLSVLGPTCFATGSPKDCLKRAQRRISMVICNVTRSRLD